jgi:gamma-glutamyl hercynylcysteine S-oxide synthase
VLLLVLQAEFDQRSAVAHRQPGPAARHALVDGAPVGQHLGQPGPRDQAALRPRVLLADAVVVAVEQHAEAGWWGRKPGSKRSSTKVSKNQVVCARCHFTGLASGIDCTWQSASDSGAASATVCARTSAKRRARAAAGMSSVVGMDARGAASAAAGGRGSSAPGGTAPAVHAAQRCRRQAMLALPVPRRRAEIRTHGGDDRGSSMHDASVTAAARAARCGGVDALAAALQASRRDTLATFAVYQAALPDLRVPQRAELNLPLWELGHIGWFQEWWLARNPARQEGVRADPDVPRRAACAPAPTRSTTRAASPTTRAGRCRCPAPRPRAPTSRRSCSARSGCSPRRPRTTTRCTSSAWALLHEDMHHEAAVYMAQGLGIAIDDARWQAAPLPPPGEPLAWGRRLAARPRRPGLRLRQRARRAHGGAGAIDHRPPRPCAGPSSCVSSRPAATPSRAGGATPAAPGAAPRAARGAAPPAATCGDGSGWQQWRHGRWRRARPRAAGLPPHVLRGAGLVRWAGRRLPTEAEWERAAVQRPEVFRWGDVWEWTAAPSRPSRVSSRTPTATIRRPGSTAGRCCAAPASPPAAFAPPALPQLLHARAQRHLRRLSQLRAVSTGAARRPARAALAGQALSRAPA